MARSNWKRRKSEDLVLRVPSAVPELTPEASRALLALLIEISEEQRRAKPPEAK